MSFQKKNEIDILTLGAAMSAGGGGGTGDGDMKKAVYDTNNDGVVDAADTANSVSGHTVAKDVPADAVFTDTVYDDTALSGRVTALESHVTQTGDVVDSDGHSLHIVGEAIETTKTVSGNPIVITDALALPAVSLSANITPEQNLHGYDHPWAGGAGKNFADYSAEHSSSVGNTYTYNEYDGWIKEEWASGGQHQLVLSVPFVERLRGNKITISITSADISNQRMSDWRIFLLTYINGGSESIVATLNPATNLRSTITLNDNITEIRILLRMSQGGSQSLVAGDNIVFHGLQLEVSESPTSYAPYSNICPISGRTEARVDTENEDSTESAYAVIQLGTTVYGAEVDFDTGMVTIDRAIKDFGDLTWTMLTSGYNRFRAQISDKVDTKGANEYLICSCYPRGTSTAHDDNTIWNEYATTKKDVVVRNDAYNSADAFKTAMTGQTICYEIAEPQTIQLTATQLQLLAGYNRLTIEDGTITLTYRANKADSVQAEVDVLETSKADNADVVDYIENGNTASRAYTANQFMLWKGDLYKVTTSIASGATITAGTNVSKTTIGAVLTALLNA